jgi:hypothetical protein
MSTIHLVLTGKGGVGKSYISALLAQYIKSTFGVPFVADTDPSNPTIASYPEFKAKHINIMTNDMNIDKSKFDELIEHLLSYEGDCVVDNGASSFLPMMAYMMENNVIDLLREAGKTVIIHAVMIGGLGMDETLRCIRTLLTSQVAPLVVWENEMFGPVVKDDKSFRDSQIYIENKERILGIVRIVERGPDTFGKDLKMMTSNRLTFDEIKDSTEIRIMTKQRLATVRRDIDNQLDTIDFEAT